MRYETVMVHLKAGRSNVGVLQIAGDIAERFNAAVIGIAARRPMPMVYADGYMPVELFEHDRAVMAEELEAAEAEFRTALHPRVAMLEWRSATDNIAVCDTVAAALRSADLLIASAAVGDSVENLRAADTGDLVMCAGRPVLLVPARFNDAAAALPQLQRAAVLWNDSRESRRAIVDALPLLRTAAHVAVVSVAAADDDLPATRKRVVEVVAWLARHGIPAEPVTSLASGEPAQALEAIADRHAADLIVAGAYGHSRVREWALGGVTRNLLLRPNRCTLLSH